MRPPERLLALALTLGLTNAASAGNRPFVAVGADQAAKLIIGNTVVVDTRSGHISRRYYASLDRVYECSRSHCGTHGVQIVDGQICDPGTMGKCIERGGRWFFLRGDLTRVRKGGRIGSYVTSFFEVQAILKGNMAGYPDFTIPPGPLEPVTVESKDAIPGSEDQYGQYAGRNLAALFPGNTLVETDGTFDSCLKGAEYYAPGGRLLSLGCRPRGNGKVGVDYSVWILRWRIKGGKLCTTSRMLPQHFDCLTNLDQSIAAPLILSKQGKYAPRIGRMAVQIPSSENMPLLIGNIFHFR